MKIVFLVVCLALSFANINCMRQHMKCCSMKSMEPEFNTVKVSGYTLLWKMAPEMAHLGDEVVFYLSVKDSLGNLLGNETKRFNIAPFLFDEKGTPLPEPLWMSFWNDKIGCYESNVSFTKPGNWRLTLQYFNDSEAPVQSNIFVTVMAAMAHHDHNEGSSGHSGGCH